MTKRVSERVASGEVKAGSERGLRGPSGRLAVGQYFQGVIAPQSKKTRFEWMGREGQGRAGQGREGQGRAGVK